MGSPTGDSDVLDWKDCEPLDNGRDSIEEADWTTGVVWPGMQAK